MEFKNLKALKDYTKKVNNFTEDEVVKVLDTNKYYKYHNKEWCEVELKSNVQLSLYEVNKQLMSQMKNFTNEDWITAKEKINEFDKEQEGTYYMMLCKDVSYYTVFHCDGYEFNNLGEAVEECLAFTGNVVAVDTTDSSDAVEIWVKIESETYCFYLFNYDNGVVSFKR